MGGAGAGVGGLLFVPLVFSAPYAWLFAAFIAWVLVLPRVTFVALALALLSFGISKVLWASVIGTLLNSTALYGIFILSIGGLLTAVLVPLVRIVTLFAALIRRR